MNKINTLEMEVALMRFLGIRRKLIVPNVSWGLNLGGKFFHECDLLVLSASNYASEIEIKISKADLLNDTNKKHDHSHHYIKNFYFAVPNYLKEIALAYIPKKAGLYIVHKSNSGYISVEKIKKAVNLSSTQWSDSDRSELARLGALRILGLKQKVLKQQYVIRHLKY